MPQLDLDLIEDFLFVAFAGLLLGVGDEETEERVIAVAAEAHLANLYVGGRKALRAETRLVASAARVLTSALVPPQLNTLLRCPLAA
jgi:hypothetical protein